MNARFVTLIILPSLMLGIGLGLGLSASSKPFVLEATNTPLGSFVIRCNVTYVDPLLLDQASDQVVRQDYIA